MNYMMIKDENNYYILYNSFVKHYTNKYMDYN